MKIDQTDEGVLQRFMQEFFPFDQLKDIGFFTEEMKGDYKAQAERVCTFFGYNTVYEYGAKEILGHISYNDPTDMPFITVIPSIYE